MSKDTKPRKLDKPKHISYFVNKALVEILKKQRQRRAA